MIAINHLVKEVVLERAGDKLNCWTQSKRVFMDLVRINRHSWIGLSYPPFVHVYISSLSSSQPPTSLPSTAMEGEIQHPPAQASKPSKTKSKQSTSSVSQNTGVVITTKPKNMGRVKVVNQGEGTGVSQQLQKNKEGVGVLNQSSHFMPSQKGTYVNMESNTSLLAPSQKGVNVEKGPQPGTQDQVRTQTYHHSQICSKEERNP